MIEQVDEPREEKAVKMQMDLFDMHTGRQIKGWNNELIWGDNMLILSSLKNGPLREEIETYGSISTHREFICYSRFPPILLRII